MNRDLKWGQYGIEPLTNNSIYLSVSAVLGVFMWPIPFMYVHVCVCVCPVESYFCDPVDYSLPGSSVHGILQARILE